MSVPNYTGFPFIIEFAKQFNFPQLRRRRRITVIVPHNYFLTDFQYPVLYLQDGQNVFLEGSQFGSWRVEEHLHYLQERNKGNVIIVAIDHGKRKRMREYLPYRGEGHAYIQFITDTLKPKIDAVFRTLPDRAHTGIGGSSLGGLISAYGEIIRPDVFGRAMIFSPSLFMARQLLHQAAHQYHPFDNKIYIYCGTQESRGLVKQCENLEKSLRYNKPQLHTYLKISAGGQHNERFWSDAFSQAVEWLYD